MRKQTDVMKLKDGKYSFDDGVYLIVRYDGRSRVWILQTRISGRRFRRSLGDATLMTLAQAKIEAVKMKARLLEGDTQTKSEAKASLTAPKIRTFSSYIEAIKAKRDVASWKNEKHASQWVNTMKLTLCLF